MRFMLLFLCACSTVADSGGGDVALPNARVGPFREIEQTEIGNARSAPYALRDDGDFPRDASVIDADDDPATLAVIAYAAHTLTPAGEEPDPTLPPNAILRYTAADARSFERESMTVLTPTQPWEGDTVGAPCALRHEGAIYLYYAAAGGIGLAIGDAVGEAFGEPQHVLAADGGWEAQQVPTSPAVSRLPDGSLMMFYEVPLPEGSAIGSALSDDGIHWSRVGSEPALSPEAGTLDEAGAGSPFAWLSESPLGRPIQYLYYGARDASGKATVALAAREGTRGPFSRAVGPVFGGANDLGPREPSVLSFPGFILLYATQRAGTTSAQDYPAVAVGVAPATLRLPPPSPP